MLIYDDLAVGGRLCEHSFIRMVLKDEMIMETETQFSRQYTAD